MKPIRFSTIKSAAAATGIPSTVLRDAKARGCPAFVHGRVAVGPELFKFLFDAMPGEMTFEDARRRKEIAEAKIAEAEAQQLDDGWVAMPQVEEWVVGRLLPVRQRLISLPADVCARCNPSDPELARVALQEWSDETLKFARDGKGSVKE
jgi:hypothetical protein